MENIRRAEKSKQKINQRNKKRTLLSSSVRSAPKKKKTGGEEEVNRVICLRGDVKIFIYSAFYTSSSNLVGFFWAKVCFLWVK